MAPIKRRFILLTTKVAKTVVQMINRSSFAVHDYKITLHVNGASNIHYRSA
ncbi:uncharacterized protein FOMMEDRAFT_150487 [Fomitiporia mediterranea MF3/22]|uniref:uncharacterized protein n=1 Tax=Fomitiporia mediterranea (strain MF3/22) TaxID=694068 RepID=UPI0004408105|nr:uncharacterized protein FOMMEDRAFT_150487 [Fomitiporia mediterranea MF3/22]EJD07895.1 hypothetical protein FOMMEDRAFT_150487 [Fomitiporia mediterranea MF3/22]